MQTERDSKCVAKNVDRLSDGVVVGTQIEPARASYQVDRLQIGHLERPKTPPDVSRLPPKAS